MLSHDRSHVTPFHLDRQRVLILAADEVPPSRNTSRYSSLVHYMRASVTAWLEPLPRFSAGAATTTEEARARAETSEGGELHFEKCVRSNLTRVLWKIFPLSRCNINCMIDRSALFAAKRSAKFGWEESKPRITARWRTVAFESSPAERPGCRVELDSIQLLTQPFLTREARRTESNIASRLGIVLDVTHFSARLAYGRT